LEPITHLLTGACLGRAGLNRKTGLATLTCVLAAEAPDADVLYYFRGSLAAFQHHRGFTHSFLGVPIVAAATLAAVYGIYRLMKVCDWQPKHPPRWRLLFVYALIAALSHIFLDFTNNYGVRPLAPFNPSWHSWDIAFIIDPFILTALSLGLVTPWIFALITEEVGARKSQFRGRGGAIFAFLCMAAAFLVRDYQHRRAVNLLNSITYRGEDPLRVSAFPNPVNPLAWNGVVETRDFFELVPVDSGSGQIDPQNLAVVRYKPEETPVTLAAKESRLGRVYLDWAAYPLVENERLEGNAGYRVQFQDLRFTSAETFSRRRGPPLAGYVELDSQLRVRDQYMGRADREQKRR
jgi:inner membrane protein